MTKKEVGEILIQAGTLLLIAPLLIALVFATIYLTGSIDISSTGFLILGVILYIGISIGLISYGKKLMNN